ncbi:PRD domain-containing protein [Corynebacterium poyangense]|uniref:PRD domain-containing protein n=1 Tax=Corynebacterium poyangense TaxID=2684405 RepID=A0A7H0SR33_9CORY|nr:CAT RNA binding domain-containing protein [Corynebacterium poyangense]MBZ8176432.1 PRD domain-containing protein [Corynebacterium poyangense]QNQ91008.1 PRD domain-containing protein [Corynebacterium poyangense]
MSLSQPGDEGSPAVDPEHPRILRVFSNNAVLVRGEDDVEKILVGRGIGFGRRTGERIKADQAQRTYVPLNPDTAPLIASIDQLDPAVLQHVGAAVDLATDLLGDLHPSVYLLLTEHLSFAIGRVREGQRLHTGILSEVAGAFPEEFQAAQLIVHYLNAALPETILPEEEAAAVALHLNAARSGVPVKTPLAHANLLAAWVAHIHEATGITSAEDEELVAALVRLYRRIESGQTRHCPLVEVVSQQLSSDYQLATTIIAQMGDEAPGEAAYFAVFLHGWRQAYKPIISQHIQRRKENPDG